MTSGRRVRIGTIAAGGNNLQDLQDFVRRNAEQEKQKKEHLNRDALIKMGGDLLFHKQVQYHQRGRA